MKRILVFTCVLAVLLLTCSKKSTSPPDDNNPPVDATFSVSYVADQPRAVQQHISAQSGGSVVATDKDGAQIQLDIPAHALVLDADITIIPFSSLQISGPGGAGCSGCGGTDSLCCFKGALFEPSGLVLDSSATLTVVFPQGASLPFAKPPLIVYLDSAGDTYEAQYTLIDTIAKTLSAQITHFSGYGTDDESYDRLEAQIYEAAEDLTKSIGTSSFYVDIWPMKSLHDICRIPVTYMGEVIVYSDLAELVERLMLDAYDKHAKAIQTQAFEKLPCDGLFDLRECIRNLADFVSTRNIVNAGWANHEAFSAIEANTEGDFDALFRRTALAGKRRRCPISC